ncbi:MAG: RidA family protein [Tabrizicola sp.]|nr:RidA family protein [Tabrizicola sp.]
MGVERVNPEGMYDSLGYGFSHAAISTGGRQLHLAGQVAWDANHGLVGGADLGAQARQVFANLRAVLASQGAGPADLLRLRTYVVGHRPDKIGIVAAEMMAFYGDAVPAPNTWIGVETLALPEFLIEVEGVAQLP